MGVPGGCEAVSHALTGLLASVGDTFSLDILQVDLKNAFNTLNQSSILRQVADQFPELLRWFEFCYSQPSWLKFGNSLVLSACGVQQGDPLAPLLFAITIHLIIVALKNQFPDLACNVWYLDDGFFVGDVNFCAHIFPHLFSSMLNSAWRSALRSVKIGLPTTTWILVLFLMPLPFGAVVWRICALPFWLTSTLSKHCSWKE